MMDTLDDPEFRLAVEVLYHGSRHAFLSGAHRWMMFLTILFGAAAATTITPVLSGLAVAATGAADIALDFTGRAQLHADVRRRYLALVKKLVNDPGAQVTFGADWIEISSDEPPLYRWAEQIAHRNACIALGRPVPEPLPWRKILFAHVWRA